MAAGRAVAIAAFVLLGLLAVNDVFIRAFFPHFARLSDNFSSMYLERDIREAAADRRAVVFLGDSALWGYKLPTGAEAASLLRGRGCDCRNISFEGGSPANTYAILRLLLAEGARPRTVVFNVNQKEFNPADSAYQTLHPSVDSLARSRLAPQEQRLLAPGPAQDWNARVDATVAHVWALYGMRSDLREWLFGQVDAVHALEALIARDGSAARQHMLDRPTPERFEGTYDLTPLAQQPNNVSVVFLRAIASLARRNHLRVVAILTPTNHELLKAYINTPAYDDNLRFTRRILVAAGITVIDADRSIPSAEFIDNDHLTAAGNSRLARLLAPALPLR